MENQIKVQMNGVIFNMLIRSSLFLLYVAAKNLLFIYSELAFSETRIV